MAALEPERQLAVGLAVELDPALLELSHLAGRLADEDLDHRGAAGPAPGADRVLGVELGRVVVAERRGEPALGPVARALGERLARDERDARTSLGGGQRRMQTGRPAPHNDYVRHYPD